MNRQLRNLVGSLRRLDAGRGEDFSFVFPAGFETARVDIPVNNDICREATRHLLVSLIEYVQAEAAALYPRPE